MSLLLGSLYALMGILIARIIAERIYQIEVATIKADKYTDYMEHFYLEVAKLDRLGNTVIVSLLCVWAWPAVLIGGLLYLYGRTPAIFIYRYIIRPPFTAWTKVASFIERRLPGRSL